MPHIILFLNDQRACGVKRGQGLSKMTIRRGDSGTKPREAAEERARASL